MGPSAVPYQLRRVTEGGTIYTTLENQIFDQNSPRYGMKPTLMVRVLPMR
jgi:hypothetical protein